MRGVAAVLSHGGCVVGGTARGMVGQGRGEGITVRHLASARGVPLFKLDMEGVVLLLQLVNGFVHFTLNVVSDVAHVDDLIIS